ncbi:MAG: T9SS type A sorting domain-containing protein [Saprospiraceae bacterium]|nr:T9SS type A sorting domain-containing protein [Saprospiraceae bacterium]
MKKLMFSIALLLLFTAVKTIAQEAPFNLALEPINISNLGGLQSYAFGEHNGKWLIIGGRLDGLHRRQPFATFDVAGHNTRLIVVDPVANQSWSASTTSLPAALKEQLSSTNMAFFQEGDRLYMAGGYGFSATLNDHTTYSGLIAMDVPQLIAAIQNNQPIQPFIRHIQDPGFTVTGGRLGKLYDTWYLVGGQNFQGVYNPMGPTHGPGFFQEYTNSVRRFQINDNGTTLAVQHRSPWVDTALLHRRDFNVVPQILPNGQEALTAFSGVFQSAVDLPFLNCVNIDSSGYTEQPDFQQYYNHYHAATLPLYDALTHEMHSVFFGGIAQFYDNNGVLVQDNNVPFVKTVARVTRTADGKMTEYKMPINMPDYLGASAEFIPAANVPHYDNGVLKFEALVDSSIIGYVSGGSRSTAANIFWVNDGTQSVASSVIYAVRLLKTGSSGVHQVNAQSNSFLKFQVLPNPNRGRFEARWFMKKSAPVALTIRDLDGKIIEEVRLAQVSAGEQSQWFNSIATTRSGVYLFVLETPFEKTTLKVVVDP